MKALNFDFWKNFTLENVKSSQKFKIQSCSNEKNGSLWGFKITKIDFQQNLSAETTCNFHTVYYQLGCPSLYLILVLLQIWCQKFLRISDGSNTILSDFEQTWTCSSIGDRTGTSNFWLRTIKHRTSNIVRLITTSHECS